MAQANTNQRVLSADKAAVQTISMQTTARLLERLRLLKPSGRVELDLPTTGGVLPDLALEDGNHPYIPLCSTAKRVRDSVHNLVSYIYSQKRGGEGCLRLAGGPTRGADEGSASIVCANGSVISGLDSSSFFNKRGALKGLATLPAETVFVPEEMNKVTFLQGAKAWTQVKYQFGISLAGWKAAFR